MRDCSLAEEEERDRKRLFSLSLTLSLPLAFRWRRAGWRGRTTDGKATSSVKTQVTVLYSWTFLVLRCFTQGVSGRGMQMWRRVSQRVDGH